MKILSRKSSAAEQTCRKEGQSRQVHRRIEITVEREIVTVLVRGRKGSGPGQAALERQGPEPVLSDLQGPTS